MVGIIYNKMIEVFGIFFRVFKQVREIQKIIVNLEDLLVNWILKDFIIYGFMESFIEFSIFLKNFICINFRILGFIDFFI